MLYKTIALELLQEQYPTLHHRLRLSRTLLRELDRYATDLRAAHLKWVALGTDTSAARELAVEELQDTLSREAGRYET
jgi:hypothetical protein